MIFSSTPETNDDPEPWIAATNGWEGRFATADDARSVEDSHIADVVNMQSLGFVREPRPEFDRAHKPNPILVEFRGNPDLDIWDMGFAMHETYGGEKSWELPGSLFHSFTIATPEQVNHARRVLTRLITLTEGQ